MNCLLSVKPLGMLALAMALAHSPASACGLTSHVVVGNMTIDKLQDKDLKKFLEEHREAFLLGTMVPDSIQTYMGEHKIDDSDKTSHGRTTSRTKPKAVGLTALWLDEYRKDEKMSAADKQDALAYYLGIVNHLIADGPWHHTYIDRTTDEFTKLSVTNRHQMADRDVDLEIWKKLTYGAAYKSKVPVPAGAKASALGPGKLGGPSLNPVEEISWAHANTCRLSFLHDAVHRDNHNVSVRGGVDSVLNYNRRVYNGLEAYGPYTAHANECDAVFTHAFNGKGALNDCAREAAAFLDAIWNQHKTNAGNYWVVRVDKYDYAVVTGAEEIKTVVYTSNSIIP